MKCLQCIKENKTSKVYPGAGNITAAYYPPFYDEEGNLHIHDGNTITTNYTCSNGHTWKESTTGSCWCGWPNKKDTKW